MADIAILIENLSKQYRLGTVGTGTLSDDIKRWWYQVRGKEDPFLKIGETNDRAHRGSSEYVWALRDINLEVKQGEVLGIIGKNGAGKSTLLKILSKVTGPTTGRIMAKGRIASLLEVGTGFHPELTGRENIYLNGAILGMTKHEVNRKLDEIIDFAGVERYIDTPVKRYSSGMKVRLGFAVAAFLEEEILIVDEVLAVGDAEFQKKAIGKMQEVSSGGGRTVLFVSHNMAAVKSLCGRCLVLRDGSVDFNGDTDKGISLYLGGDQNGLNYKYEPNGFGPPNLKIFQIGIRSKGQEFSDPISIDQEMEIVIDYHLEEIDDRHDFIFLIKDEYGHDIMAISTGGGKVSPVVPGRNAVKCAIPSRFFNTGQFFVGFGISINQKKKIFSEENLLIINLIQSKRNLGEWMGTGRGALRPQFLWTSEKTIANSVK